MKKLLIIGTCIPLLFSSCVAKKKFAELEAKQKRTKELLDKATVKLNICNEEKAAADSSLKVYKDKVDLLKNTNSSLLNNVGDLATLSKKEAENLERSLESIKEKDMQIKTMRDAINKKDSVTLALVTSLKGALGNLNDEDIEVNVEKGVVFISISDKLLFTSGSYNVSSKAKVVLGKVAKVVNDKKDIDFMVEGHTDNIPYKRGVLVDNWDLSVKRATAVVRVLQDQFNVDPARITAAGRSHYIPLKDNTTAENRAANRRTRIVVLPKLDQFYDMIEDGMKKATSASK
ncbi:OmpA/MotB family protein [Aquimarina agarivorans]|uniref:OmpA/MotB family protein n=1 Tax=Aquimarina agarivorans TaxID=980584 RepID=UPI000248F2EC|nr:OmpA family protein [Aquimarina agarivorans]